MKELLNILNESIEVARDGQNGYQTALEGIKSDSLKILFQEFSLQRGRFVEDLQNKIESFGEEAREEGSIKSTLHRAWINIKAVVTGKDEEAIIAECLNGDKVAIDTYAKNLKENLPSDVRFLLNDQLSVIKTAYSKLLQLENIKK